MARPSGTARVTATWLISPAATRLSPTRQSSKRSLRPVERLGRYCSTNIPVPPPACCGSRATWRTRVARIRDGRCVLAAAAAARFEHRRVFHLRCEGFDCRRMTAGGTSQQSGVGRPPLRSASRWQSLSTRTGPPLACNSRVPALRLRTRGGRCLLRSRPPRRREIGSHTETISSGNRPARFTTAPTFLSSRLVKAFSGMLSSISQRIRTGLKPLPRPAMQAVIEKPYGTTSSGKPEVRDARWHSKALPDRSPNARSWHAREGRRRAPACSGRSHS